MAALHAFEFGDLILPSEEEDFDDWDDEDVEAMQAELAGDGEKIGDLACRDKKALSDPAASRSAEEHETRSGTTRLH